MTTLEDTVVATLTQEASRVSLVSTRIAAMMGVVPLPWAYAPKSARAGLVLAIALAIAPSTRMPELTSVPSWVVLALGEAVIGAAAGIVVRLLLSAPQVMANASSPNLGLGMAQVFDPTESAPEPVLSKMLGLLGVLLALVLGVHRWLLGALLHSFESVPIGSPLNLGAASLTLFDIGVDAFELGVRLALPLIAALFLVQLALAFITRAAPAMQIFSVGFAVTLLVGFASLVLILPDLVHALSAALSRTGHHLARVFEAFRS